MVHDAETELIAAIRENTAAQGGGRNEYEISQELSKGQGTSTQDDLPGGTWGWWRRNAFGLDRVPYDDFPALLHEGERVLTAQEAWAQDRAAEITRAEPAVTTWAEDILAGARASAGRLDVTSGPAAVDQHSAEPTRIFNFDFSGSTFGDGLSAEEIAQRLADAIELKFAAGVLS